MVSDNRRKLKCVEKLSGEATATVLGPAWVALAQGSRRRAGPGSQLWFPTVGQLLTMLASTSTSRPLKYAAVRNTAGLQHCLLGAGSPIPGLSLWA